jgi:hypothetical protein
MVVSVWRLVNTFRWCVVFLAYAWFHFELEFLAQFTASLYIISGAELHLSFDEIFYIAELS